MSASSLSKKPFGRTPDGDLVTLYTLADSTGIEVDFMDYGATLVSIRQPDRDGVFGDVVMGFDSLQDYFENPFYCGATVGRFANRIAGGRFVLDDEEHALTRNERGNTLHGGTKGFDKHLWRGEMLDGEHAAICFRRRSPHGEEGFPGTVDVSVVCSLTEDACVEFAFEATTDRATVINLANHAYFNLGGSGDGSICDHVLSINASRHTPVDASQIPTGDVASVEGTALDFRTPRRIGDRLHEAGGYDHNYLLEKTHGGATALEWAATLYDPASGREMQVFTDQPGMQFYSGNFLDGRPGRDGRPCAPHTALALETQHFPDSPNQPGFPSTVLRPGEVFRTTTRLRFSARPS